MIPTEISLSMQIDTRAARNQEALGISTDKFVNRRSSVLERSIHN